MNGAGEQFTGGPELSSRAEAVPGSAQLQELPSATSGGEPSAPGPPTPVRVRNKHTSWMGSLQSLLITVIIAVFVITFIVQAFQIPSPSMENTLLVGDYLLVDKAHFGPGGIWSWLIPYQKIRRGDVIVFRYPVDPKEHFVKRVIGTPGDRVRLINKRVYVNGERLPEPYVIHSLGNYDSFRDNFPGGELALGHLSSQWTNEMQRLVENGQLIVPDGFYFVLGDNRDDSMDSRYWGFVPRENIVGRPLVIYWSMREFDGLDDHDEGARPGDKLARLGVAVKECWHDLRWRRMLTLVR